HCRLQVGETIHELDEPRLVSPAQVQGLSPTAAGVMDWLGFRYLLLRQFSEHAGSLAEPGLETLIESLPSEADTADLVPTA
ncbi:MAG TPA: hypothetical protein VJ506_09775, partial [Candidatus Limnocylindrales bacterium]|nr:hypothetical protein [Candidatus Limnocylindrales bacterium]